MNQARRLPGPVADSWEWQLRGACRGCPVLAQCRAHALTAQELYGVWGGLSETDRRASSLSAGY
ncbi:WhiB family transcriptional regulator [Amycolatopsis sp. NBC_00345]|uniref:WhiB family transcriptional regulator n=1 Tax=Amycolatopsis sp. NBC_00345 TaxID=2975955 RepID=UPI002E269E6C